MLQTGNKWKKNSKLPNTTQCWFGFLRRMFKGGFCRTSLDIENKTHFSLVYTNTNLDGIVKSQLLKDFMDSQYLKYIARICHHPNTN